MAEENAVSETNDNVGSETSLLDGTVSSETQEQDTTVTEEKDFVVADNDFGFVPAKFIGEDGKPDFEKLANSYTELEKKASEKNLSAEAIDEYEFKFTSDTFDADADLTDIKEHMLELGISKDQYAGVMEMWEGAVTDIITDIRGTPESALEAVQEMFGDKAETALLNAKNAFERFAPEGMDINEIGNNPQVIALLASIGSQMGEDSRPPQGTRAQGMTQTEVDEIINRPDYYTNQEMQDRVAAYYEAQQK